MKKVNAQTPKKNRVDYLSEWIKPGWRFLTGLICLFIFISLNQLVYRLLSVGIFGVLAVTSGKKISWLYFLSFLFFVVFFHLLSPFGLVLFQLGPFPITSGALQSGLDKGFLFIGFVFNSLFSVQRNLKIPGRFGQIVARMFIFFEMLYENKNTIGIKTLLTDIDAVLTRTWNEAATTQPNRKNVSKFRSFFTLMLISLLFCLIKAGDWIFR